MDPFEIPEDITALDGKTLREGITKAQAEIVAIDGKGEELPDEDITRLVALMQFIDSATERVPEVEKDAADRTAVREAARAKAAEKVPAEKKAEAKKEPAKPKEDPKPEPVEPPAAEVEPEVEPIAASAAPRRGLAARAASGTPAADVPVREVQIATITAAAEVPGVLNVGAEMTMDNVAAAITKRFSAFPHFEPGEATTQIKSPFNIANIKFNRTDDFSDTNPKYATDTDSMVSASLQEYEDRILQMATDAASEARLPGGSLVAAAGWCAPSETVYGLCPGLESTDGIWDLPTIQLSRGGINFTKGPQISDVFNHAGFWHYTEAQVIAGVTKPCFTVPCPSFTEKRLEVDGICIRAGILQREGYPEIIKRYVDLTMTAHVHQLSGRRITDALALAGAAVTPTAANVWQNTNTLLVGLELLALGERQALRMSESQTLEILLPVWLKAAIRADVANRINQPFQVVTDADILAQFAARGLRPQFVYNYQDLALTGGIVQKFPATVEVLMYPAGTFVGAGKDLLNLSGVYDTTDLKANEYTELFTEESYLVLNPCYTARRIVLPVSPTGRLGAANIHQVYGNAAAIADATA